uniref:Thymosin beta 1 n=1 Tax=Poecilia mexicana TaxID=48701 RepID=A0A3B3YFQ7_9TELE
MGDNNPVNQEVEQFNKQKLKKTNTEEKNRLPTKEDCLASITFLSEKTLFPLTHPWLCFPPIGVSIPSPFSVSTHSEICPVLL